MLFTISVTNFSCDKVDLGNLEKYDVSFDEVESVMQTESMLNIAFIDIFNIGLRAGAFADEHTVNNSAKKSVVDPEDIMGGGMSILYTSGSITDKTEIPVTVLIEWGDVNNIGTDGFARRGSIVATLTNTNWINAGAVVTISFRDYYFQGYKITGEVTLKNLGSGVFEIIVKDGVFTSPDGKVSKRNSDLFFKWIEGKETLKDVKDDVWHIYGTVDGVTSNEMEYSIKVEENKYLEKSICEFPTKGVADFMIKKVKFTLDYAPIEEECDNIAEVNFYGKKKIIKFGEDVN